MNRVLLRVVLLAATACALVILAVFAVLEYHDLHGAATATVAGQADAVADAVASSADVDLLRAVVASTASGAAGDLAVHLSDDQTVGTSRASAAQLRDARAAHGPVSVSLRDGTLTLRPVRRGDGSIAVVESFLPTTQVLGPLATRLGVLLGGGLVGIGVAVFVGYRRTRPLVGSVRAIAAAAGTIGQGRTGIEIPPSDAAEISQLISALNQTSQRVEQLIASEREFVADLSHRLRTPLTALRLDSESIGDGPVAQRVRQAAAALEADVDHLIRTAERASTARTATCDAAAVVAERMAFWSALAEHQGRRCDYTPHAEHALISMPDKEFGAVVDSLLGNVFQHTPPGTAFATSVVSYAGWVTLVVEDAGPGIADSETALRRGVSGHGSTGLGLDIARHAVEATGGNIHIDRGALGGARIRLRFAEAGAHHASPAPKAWRLWSRSAE